MKTSIILIFCPVFKKNFKSVFKSYPRSASTFIENLRPDDMLPRSKKYPKIFGSCDIRKIRYGLNEYNIGQSDGIRLIFIVHEIRGYICPIFMYLKKQLNHEIKVLKETKKALKAVKAELNRNVCHDTITP